MPCRSQAFVDHVPVDDAPDVAQVGFFVALVIQGPGMFPPVYQQSDVCAHSMIGYGLDITAGAEIHPT